ncbi:MAG TPA: heterodisulfide reductase-related iron-sulfur binding cluster, partial [Gaiellaceae bacterium]|nr:heterodisulfide reductase-related iron-sulfur binding cluster [Gaiellaceae bacterium]
MIDGELIADCVHCGFCLPTCPTYGPLWQQEMDSPRGRIWLMKGLAEGTLDLTDTVVEHFDRCLGCMACMTACPSGVQYDRLIEQTRELIEDRHERAPDDWLVRKLVFGVFPYPLRLRVALALAPLGRRAPVPAMFRPLVDLAPPWRDTGHAPELTPAAGEARARVGLLLGCVQRVLFGDVNAATARVLAAEGCDVIAPAKQQCCGALHLHAGRRAEGHERAHRLAGLFRRAGAERIVVNAAGCGSHLKDAGLDLPGVDVSELLAELEPRAE